MLIRILMLSIILLINTPYVWAYMECIVNTDCFFLYVPRKISDGYSHDATLTISSPSDDIDVFYFYEDALSSTEIIEANQTDICPPGASQVCLTHLGNGVYKIGIDATLNNAAGKKLCLDVRDVQTTRTVADEVLCNYSYVQSRLIVGDQMNLTDDAITAPKIAAGAIGTSEAPNLDVAISSRLAASAFPGDLKWGIYNILDLDNESGQGGTQNPTTTSADTDLIWTENFSNTTPQPIMYYPTTVEESTQDSNCNVQGFRTGITAYNTTTKIITYNALPVAPDYRCKFRIY